MSSAFLTIGADHFKRGRLTSGSPRSVVDTIEGDPIHVRAARLQIAAAGLADRITVHLGEFEEVLRNLNDVYDLIFFDGFAPSKSLLLLLRSMLRQKGTLVCSNIGLADGQQQSEITAELAITNHWHSVDSIEQGRTIVVTKN